MSGCTQAVTSPPGPCSPERAQHGADDPLAEPGPAAAVGDDDRELAVDDARDGVDLAGGVDCDPRDVGHLVGLGQELQVLRRQVALEPVVAPVARIGRQPRVEALEGLLVGRLDRADRVLVGAHIPCIARNRAHLSETAHGIPDQAASGCACSTSRRRLSPSRIRLFAVPSGTPERRAICAAVSPPQ